MNSKEQTAEAIRRIQRIEEAKAQQTFADARDAYNEAAARHRVAQTASENAGEKLAAAERAHAALVLRKPKIMELSRSEANRQKLRRALATVDASLAEARRQSALAEAEAERARASLEASLRKRESLAKLKTNEDRRQANTKVRRAENDRDPWRGPRRPKKHR